MNHHPTRRTALGALAASGLAGLAPAAWAQASSFPTKPIKIIMPWAAGGGGDVLVRAMLPALPTVRVFDIDHAYP